MPSFPHDGGGGARGPHPWPLVSVFKSRQISHWGLSFNKCLVELGAARDLINPPSPVLLEGLGIWIETLTLNAFADSAFHKRAHGSLS